MRNNKLVQLVIKTEQKTINFDLPQDACINLKHAIYSTINYNDLLAENTVKR